MKILSLLLLTVIYCFNLAYSQQAINNAVNKFVNDPSFSHASISFNLIDLNDNSTIASFDKSRTLATASTAKLWSTATALKTIGSNYRPSTRLYYDGIIDSLGVLHGNIWIRGGGDPTLGSKYYSTPETKSDFLLDWVKEIKSLGITKITGGVIGDASEFGYNGAPDGWSWVDLGNYYGAGASGLTVYDNLIEYTFKTSSVGGRTAELLEIKPYIPDLMLHNYVKSSNKKGDNSYIYGAPYSLDRFGTGTLPVNKSRYIVKGSLPDPEFQIAFELENRLRASEIIIEFKAKGVRKDDIPHKPSHYDRRTLILTHKGQKLIDIITLTNHKSINLFAEHMVNLVGFEKSGDGSIENGLRVIDQYWSSKINTKSMHLNDGSGLSRTNAISAEHYTQLLAYMHKDALFFNSLPVSGKSGTLKSLCRGQSADGKIHAKSGTMNRIKSYAGYIYSSTGKKYAFAIIVNNFDGSSSQVKTKMERLFNAISVN